MTEYTILDFVNEVKKVGSDQVKISKLIKEIEIKQYVPYGTKVRMAERMVRKVCLEDGDFKFNSPKRYLTYVLSIIVLYTNLKCAEEDSTIEYDALKSSGLLERILKEIGEDIEEYKVVWTMCYEDLVQNESSIPVLIRKNVERFAFICDNGLEKVAELIQKLPEKDVEKIVNTVKNRTQNLFRVK